MEVDSSCASDESVCHARSNHCVAFRRHFVQTISSSERERETNRTRGFAFTSSLDWVELTTPGHSHDRLNSLVVSLRLPNSILPTFVSSAEKVPGIVDATPVTAPSLRRGRRSPRIDNRPTSAPSPVIDAMEFNGTAAQPTQMGQMALGDFARVACEADKRARGQQFLPPPQSGATSSQGMPMGGIPQMIVAPNHGGFVTQGGWVVARPEHYPSGHDQSASFTATSGMPVHSLSAASAGPSDSNGWTTASPDGVATLPKGGRAGKVRGKRAPARSLTVSIPAHCQGDGELGWNPILLEMSTIELNDWINKSRMEADHVKALKSLRRRIKNRRYTQKARERKRTDAPEDASTDDDAGVETRSIGVQSVAPAVRTFGTQTEQETP